MESFDLLLDGGGGLAPAEREPADVDVDDLVGVGLERRLEGRRGDPDGEDADGHQRDRDDTFRIHPSPPRSTTAFTSDPVC